MRFPVLVAVLVCWAATACAQPISAYAFRVYNQGAASPVQGPTPVALTCNQPMPPSSTGIVLNPNTIAVKDLVNAGKACLLVDTGTGPLVSLPFGTQAYEATMTATNTAGTSPESARSNLFSHPGAAPPAPQGLQIAKILSFGKTVFGFRRGRVPSAEPMRLMPARVRTIS